MKKNRNLSAIYFYEAFLRNIFTESALSIYKSVLRIPVSPHVKEVESTCKQSMVYFMVVVQVY